MITGDYSPKQHNNVEHLEFYLDLDLTRESLTCRVLRKINAKLNFL